MASLDLLLIKPGKQKLVYGNLSSSLHAIEPPLWAGLLAGYLREKGYSVQILDAEAENIGPGEICDRVKSLSPVLAGVVVSGTNPSASTMNMTAAAEILTGIKSAAPRVKTIITGLHPSALPERTLSETDADFLCEGEGFYTLDSLLQVLKSGPEGGDLDIGGLWYKKDEKIVSN
ncbi:MAG: cobalamin-dependent protein, partial [Desulfocucumaceae bacterium]